MYRIWRLWLIIKLKTAEAEAHPLGSVHYAIADLYCSGWYMDMISEAAIFHLETAARKFRNIKAMTILGTKLLGQDTDELEDLELPKVRSPFFTNFELLQR